MGAILLFIAKNPAQVFNLIANVMKLIASGYTWVQIHEKMATFSTASEKAEKDKDATDLEAIFRKPSDNP